MSVGRIASCAPCAPSFDRNLFGVSGTYSGPYSPAMNALAASRAWSSVARRLERPTHLPQKARAAPRTLGADPAWP